MNKNSDIEILRALAITMGLLQHLPILAGPNVAALELMGRYFGFWGGVDLFFVISGFLITRLLFKYVDLIETGGDWLLELKTFWIKRAFRLMPAAWVWLLIPLLLAASIPNIFPPLQTLTHDALAALLNVADFYWPYCVTSGKAGSLCSSSATLLPYWSLSLEEQFYVALPALLLFIRRRWLVPVIIAALIALLAWSRPLFSLGWFLRIDALLWGYYRLRQGMRCSSRAHY
jgi:peptidoglycan/LPS O-acetylase OafA/YrhL